MSERETALESKVIDLLERRRRRRARSDATRDIQRAMLRPPRERRGGERYVIELTASRPLYDKLMLAKLLLSDQGDEATMSDAVEVALEIWLGDVVRPPDR